MKAPTMTVQELRDEFETQDIPEDIEVLLVLSQYQDYSGSILVVYRYQGKLYEVNGGHCSCYGFEGQWEPEETTPEALAMRELGDSYWTWSDPEELAGARELIQGLGKN